MTRRRSVPSNGLDFWPQANQFRLFLKTPNHELLSKSNFLLVLDEADSVAKNEESPCEQPPTFGILETLEVCAKNHSSWGCIGILNLLIKFKQHLKASYTNRLERRREYVACGRPPISALGGLPTQHLSWVTLGWPTFVLRPQLAIASRTCTLNIRVTSLVSWVPSIKVQGDAKGNASGFSSSTKREPKV